MVRRSRPPTAERHALKFEGVSVGVESGEGVDGGEVREGGKEKMPGRRLSLKGSEVGPSTRVSSRERF